MAVIVLTTDMAGAVNYTHTTASSVDWPAVPIDTYFYDLDVEIVYYKDASGNVVGAYDPDTGLISVATDGVSIVGDGTAANPLVAVGSSGGNLLLTGGATYSGTGLVFDVSALTYLIAGVNYATIPTQVTLNSGDPTFSRFDAIVADELQVVSVIQGTPSATPVTPSIEADQVLIQYVLIGINATTPTITTEYVYREGSSPDWTTSVFGNNNTADFSSTTPSPYVGLECILAEQGRYGYTRGIRFSTGIPISRDDYVQLSFWIYLTVDLIAAGKTRGYVFLYADNTPVSAEYVGYARFESFIDMTLTGQWQLVSIPTAQFSANPINTTIGFLNITMWPNLGSYTPVEFALDEIKFSTGYGPSTNIATIDILENDVTVAPTARLNFKDTATTTALVTNDPLTNTVDVEISNISGSGGIYNGSGSLISTAVVNADNFQLDINESNALKQQSLFDVSKGGIPNLLNVVSSFYHDGITNASGMTILAVTNVISGGATAQYGIASLVKGHAASVETASIIAQIGNGTIISSIPVDSDIGVLCGLDSTAANFNPTAYGIYAIVISTASTTNIAGYFEAANGVSNHGIQIVDGTEGVGKVLTSDVNGIGRWEAIPDVKKTWNWGATRNFNTVTDQYIRTFNGTPNNLAPYIVPFDCTLTDITCSSSVVTTWNAQVHVNGVSVAQIAIVAADSGTNTGLSVVISAGDKVTFYCDGTSSYPHIQAWFKET